LKSGRADYRDIVSLAEAGRLIREGVSAGATATGSRGGAGADTTYAAPVERVDLCDAAGRVLAEPVVAAENVPGFDRSTVDGYAVIAADTFGAGEGAPALLISAGEVVMGRPATVTLGPGQVAAVPTGGMLPGGADAVVMIEHTVAAGEGLIEVTRPVAPGENVVRIGEDVACGAMVLPAGRRLTPADLGVLAAVGVTGVACQPRPRVAVIPTGDEIVPATSPACGPGQVRDITSVALAALVRRDGGEADVLDIVPDREEAFEAALSAAVSRYDLVFVLGGSSVGARDHTASVIDRLGPPGLVFHGLALKPGKPTIFGLCRPEGDRGCLKEGEPAPQRAPVPVFGLPGHPVSGLVVYEVLIRPVVRRVAGETVPDWASHPAVRPAVAARLATAVASDQGREEYLCVRLVRDEVDHDDAGRVNAEPAFFAEPVPGKSGLITMLARADGLARIPAGLRGLERGARIEVIPLA
jgi:molybdopterin molybdotransferase